LSRAVVARFVRRSPSCDVHRSLPRGARQLLSFYAAVALAPSLTGCGGAMPLGHPAHALSRGKTTLAAGVAATVVGESSATVVGASSTTASPGRLQDLTVAPDISPWVSARVGLGHDFEAGIGASARALRLDARRAFATKKVALSIGLGVSGVLAARPGARAGVYGGGIDVPVLIGWRSAADLYAAWIGTRIGAELLSGKLDAGASGAVSAVARHLRFGGVAGLRAGFRRLYGLVEVEVAYHHADGSLGTQSISLEGFTVAPAGALVVSF
jgi:hypothetical protein